MVHTKTLRQNSSGFALVEAIFFEELEVRAPAEPRIQQLNLQ